MERLSSSGSSVFTLEWVKMAHFVEVVSTLFNHDLGRQSLLTLKVFGKMYPQHKTCPEETRFVHFVVWCPQLSCCT